MAPRTLIAADRSFLLLFPQEGSVVFPVDLECHAVPPGNSLANVRVVVPVELDQINFLALDCVLLEMVEPLHSGITRYYSWWHVLSKAAATGVVQTSVAGRSPADMMELWELRNVFQLGGGKEVGVAVQRGGELKQLKVVLQKGI